MKEIFLRTGALLLLAERDAGRRFLSAGRKSSADVIYLERRCAAKRVSATKVGDWLENGNPSPPAVKRSLGGTSHHGAGTSVSSELSELKRYVAIFCWKPAILAW